jgi:hypothetical protein
MDLIQLKLNNLYYINLNYMTNFRGSSYSIETDKDVSFSQANE